MLKLTAHFYRYHDADLTAEVPAEALQGWDSKILEVPREESALVCMHFANLGIDSNVQYTPDSPFAAWFRVQEYFSRAVPIIRKVMPPLLAAARSCGLSVIHVSSGPNPEKYPGYALAKEAAGPQLPKPEGAPASPLREAWDRDRGCDVYGPHNPPNLMLDRDAAALIDFPPQVMPVDNEPVVVATHQLNAVCRQRGIWHLVYCGFCVNDCMQTSPGGMVDMTRLGYACSVIRDATTACEYRETARRELCKEIGLCKVALTSGYVFDSADLIAALENEGLT